MCYLATPSCWGAARRLGKPHIAPGFLLAEHQDFAPRLREYCRRVLGASTNGGLTVKARGELIGGIRHAIEAFAVAGLNSPDRRNWYPIDPRDLLNAAAKLEATESGVK